MSQVLHFRVKSIECCTCIWLSGGSSRVFPTSTSPAAQHGPSGRARARGAIIYYILRPDRNIRWIYFTEYTHNILYSQARQECMLNILPRVRRLVTFAYMASGWRNQLILMPVSGEEPPWFYLGWLTFLSNVVTLAQHRYVVLKYVALTPHPATCLIM